MLKPIASCGLTNTTAIVIYKIEDERLLSAYVTLGEAKSSRKTWSKIQYNKDGRAFFKKGYNFWYLDEFMRL